jgi:parallel beta-helix repeat protein
VRRSGTEQGVEIAAGADNVVAGCTISESTWAGLHIVNAIRTVVTGNRIVQNRQSGILLRKAGTPEDVRSCDDCIISGNEISGNNSADRSAREVSWAGIEIESGNNVVIENNVLDDNHSAAIYIHPGNVGTKISANELRGTHVKLLVNRGEGTQSDITG